MREGTVLSSDNNIKTVKQFVTWNEHDGFTIGLIHSHPAGTQPSAADVFTLLDPLKIPNLVNGGATAINYYKTNFSVTVVVYDATYVLKIRDITKLQALQREYALNNRAFNEKVSSAIAIKGDYDAGFLSVFENAVILYKAGAKDNLFKAAKFDNNGNLILIQPCL